MFAQQPIRIFIRYFPKNMNVLSPKMFDIIFAFSGILLIEIILWTSINIDNRIGIANPIILIVLMIRTALFKLSKITKAFLLAIYVIVDDFTIKAYNYGNMDIESLGVLMAFQLLFTLFGTILLIIILSINIKSSYKQSVSALLLYIAIYTLYLWLFWDFGLKN